MRLLHVLKRPKNAPSVPEPGDDFPALPQSTLDLIAMYEDEPCTCYASYYDGQLLDVVVCGKCEDEMERERRLK